MRSININNNIKCNNLKNVKYFRHLDYLTSNTGFF